MVQIILSFAEMYRIKVLLNKNYEHHEDWLKEKIAHMKLKFDKHWDECNLLRAIGAFQGPRCKMSAIEFIYN